MNTVTDGPCWPRHHCTLLTAVKDQSSRVWCNAYDINNNSIHIHFCFACNPCIVFKFKMILHVYNIDYIHKYTIRYIDSNTIIINKNVNTCHSPRANPTIDATLRLFIADSHISEMIAGFYSSMHLIINVQLISNRLKLNTKLLASVAGNCRRLELKDDQFTTRTVPTGIFQFELYIFEKESTSQAPRLDKLFSCPSLYQLKPCSPFYLPQVTMDMKYYLSISVNLAFNCVENQTDGTTRQRSTHTCIRKKYII